MINELENRENIYKISVDMENLAYKIAHVEDELAKLSAVVQELNEEK
jgi:superfamily II DNA helicase RecQ